jgi:mono/diheme cytochrome c family protein
MKDKQQKLPIIHLIWPVVLIGGLILARSFWGSTTYAAGEKIYAKSCASCHGPEGKGFKTLIPPLAGADYLEKETALLPCIILHGQEGEIVVNGVTYNQPMAGVGFDENGLPRLSPSQIQSLINYIRNSWGNEAPTVSRKQVQQWLEECDK